MSQPVHRDDLFDFCLFERRRQTITTDSSPVARFAKFVAEHQLEPDLRTFVFSFLKSSHEFARDWNFSYPRLFNMMFFRRDEKKEAEKTAATAAPQMALTDVEPFMTDSNRYKLFVAASAI